MDVKVELFAWNDLIHGKETIFIRTIVGLKLGAA